MKEVRVEVVVHYHAEWTIKIEKIEKSFAETIQKRVDEVLAEGYKLMDTNSTVYGGAVYTQLYFEKI